MSQSYRTVSQTQFTKGKVTTEVVENLGDTPRFGVRAWFGESYLGVEWYITEREARMEARRLINIKG
jgi:hypothetical protein